MLQNIDHVFEKAGIPYSYGFAIIALTLVVKIVTYPLTKKQACALDFVCNATVLLQFRCHG